MLEAICATSRLSCCAGWVLSDPAHASILSHQPLLLAAPVRYCWFKQYCYCHAWHDLSRHATGPIDVAHHGVSRSSSCNSFSRYTLLILHVCCDAACRLLVLDQATAQCQAAKGASLPAATASPAPEVAWCVVLMCCTAALAAAHSTSQGCHLTGSSGL